MISQFHRDISNVPEFQIVIQKIMSTEIQISIRKIANRYGLRHQLLKLREEAQELIDALDEFDHSNPEAIDHIVEEAADVSVVTQQVVFLLNAQDAFEEMQSFKIYRQLERMKEGEVQPHSTNTPERRA